MLRERRGRALLVWLTANAVGLTLAYGFVGARLVERAPSQPAASTAWFALAWVAAASLCLAAGLWLLARAVRPLRWVSFVLVSSLWIAAVIDARTYELIGVHVYSPSVLSALSNPAASREVELSAATLAMLTGMATLVLVGQVGAFRLARRLAVTRGRLVAGSALGALVAVSLTAPLAPTAPTGADRFVLDGSPPWHLWHRTAPLDPEAVSLRWDPPSPPKLARTPDVLFVLIESLRADTLDAGLRDVAAAARETDCRFAPRHYAGGHTTEFGVFSLLYSLDSPHYAPFLAAGLRSWPVGVLRAAGYRSRGASASALRAWNGAGFMTASFDTYLEEREGPGFRDDEKVVEHVRRWLAEPGPDFVFAFLDSPHHNYSYPPDREVFTPVIAEDYDHFLGDERLRETAEQIHNRYRNAVAWTNVLLTGLLRALAPRIRAGDLVVVISGDHGEEFWEHGLLGHAAPTFVEERVRVPLIACLPGDTPPFAQPTGHVDVWPTVLEALGARTDPTAWSSGRPMTEQSPNRLAFVGGLDFPWGERRALAVSTDDKHHLALCSDARVCLRVEQTTALNDRDARAPSGDTSALTDRVASRLQRFLEIAR